MIAHILSRHIVAHQIMRQVLTTSSSLLVAAQVNAYLAIFATSGTGFPFAFATFFCHASSISEFRASGTVLQTANLASNRLMV
jgi:hypothetical protein